MRIVTGSWTRSAGVAVVLGALGLAAPQVLGVDGYSCALPLVISSGSLPVTIPLNTGSGSGARPANDASDPAIACSTTKAGQPLNKPAYFSFTPAVTGSYQMDTIGSTAQQPPVGANPNVPTSYDSILSVYTGTCGALQPVSNGCDDDSGGSGFSSATMTLTAGVTYKILVSEFGGICSVFDTSCPAGTQYPALGGALVLNLRRARPTYTSSYLVPVVSFERAGAGMQRMTDVRITNLESSDALVALQFLGHQTPTTLTSLNPTASADQPLLPNDVPVPANGTLLLSNVLGNAALGGIAGNTFGKVVDDGAFGSLKVLSTKSLAVGSRTYTNDQRGLGTFGRFSPGIPLGGTDFLRKPDAPSGYCFGTPEKGRLTGIRSDATAHTDLGFFNVGDGKCQFKATLKDSAGAILKSLSFLTNVAPSSWAQQDLMSFFGTITGVSSISDASIELEPLSVACVLGAVAFVYDGSSPANGTNDADAIPMVKQPCDPVGSVTSLTATAATSTSIDVKWDVPAGATRYSVYRDGVPIYTGCPSTGSQLTFTDQGRQPSTQYCYKVLPVNSCVTGVLSTDVCATTPAN